MAALLGVGVATAPSAAAAAPDAPLSVTLAQNGPTMLDVTWQDPASDGGSAITSWAVTANPGNHACWFTPTGDSHYCRINTLTSGVTYTVTVAAVNADGTGPATAADPFVFNEAPAGATEPGAPVSVTLTQNGPTTLDVSWEAPLSDGGAAVQWYGVRANPGNHPCWRTPAGTARTCPINTLTAGVEYTVSVSAQNEVGVGPSTVSAPFVFNGPVTPAPTASPTAAPAPTSTPPTTAPGANAQAVQLTPTSINGPTRLSAVACRPSWIRWRVTTDAEESVSGERVVVLVRPRGSTAGWRTYRTLVTDDLGYALLGTTLLGDTEFQLRYAGSGGKSGSVGPVVVVNVAGAVTSRQNALQVRRGARATVGGSIVTNARKPVVLLQVRVGRSWRTVAQTNVGLGKTYLFLVPTATRGRAVYRVVRAASPELAAAIGPAVAFTVN